MEVEVPEDARLCIRLCRSVSMFLPPPVVLPETDAVPEESAVASLLLSELWECNAAIRLWMNAAMACDGSCDEVLEESELSEESLEDELVTPICDSASVIAPSKPPPLDDPPDSQPPTPELLEELLL